MSIYTKKTIDEFSGESIIVDSAKAEKIRRDPNKHYPNKDEAQELRRIMSSTGLSEAEILQIPKYRKMLSTAQKLGEERKKSKDVKWFQSQIKKACKQTKLAPQHPETIKVLEEILKKEYNTPWSNRPWHSGKHNAVKVIELYSKK